MKDDLTEEQNKAILDALNKAIDTGPWEESNFLKTIGANLCSIRDKFINVLGEMPNLENGIPRVGRHHEDEVHQEVFIALYSSEGNNMQAWERILSNLPRQIISRPVYADESGVQSIIKTKTNKINEAYVAIGISQSSILNLPQDKIPIDKLGNPLLSIKDRSLNMENISRFVHYSGTYNYVKGRLFKKE